jgi:glycosyltransferase involved in cell wall biosynthesis
VPESPRPAIRAHRALYASFDRVPSPKGAATHIERFAGALFRTFGGGLLHVLGGGDLAAHETEGSLEVVRHPGREGNFLDRAESFGRSLARVLDDAGDALELCHFRDPWSGVPILSRPHAYRTVYEINGLPSIELPGTYPLLSPRTLDKIRQAERFCWERADALVVPSRTIADNLVGMGADRRRIAVIPNGADPVVGQPSRPAEAPDSYFVYFGALQAWQGLDVLLQAFARLADLDTRLVVCSSSPPRQEKRYRKLAARLGLEERVVWLHALGRSELGRWVAHAEASVAPLVECARNLDQGCCPLKILESFALGTPVVASDIPAVREIVVAGTGRLVHPGRPAELARALRLVLEFPEASQAMARRGRLHLEENLTWERSEIALARLYRNLSENHLWVATPSSPSPPEGMPWAS